MKKNNFIKYSIFAGALVLGVSCTNLDEQILDATDISKADPDAVLTSAYNGLRQFEGQDGIFAVQEVTTDFVIVPTRAGDWGDGGAWLQDHHHTWDANSREINTAWRQMLSSVYNCDLALAIQGIPASKKAQAQFLKAYYYYNAIDLYGQVPYREGGSSPDDFPKVWTSPEATAKIIALLEEALPNLPAKNTSDPSIASKDAANFLLAKIYLNKAVFDAPTHIGFNANNVANMNKVIQYVNAISSATSLANDYWDNFKPANHTSPELIFTAKNIIGVEMGGVRTRWYMGNHYNQVPSGWNGFSVLQEYYDKFNPSDRRIKNDDSAIIAAFGSPLGMRRGQQYDLGGVVPLKTRAQNGSLPLDFQSDLAGLPADGKIISENWLERWGIRPQKYIPDVTNMDKPENDYVLFRYADALLMKAEAIVRGGTSATTVVSIAVQLQARQGISTVIDLSTLAGIDKARATELWEEGWRRNDMIRFGTYTTSRATMKNTDAYRVLLPIPTTALLNPNIKQNPGYN
ncbi:RagB/SusD family nutrient uptake outer membrane protein [Flavobacterium franklandianum]|uniref:RagB/SusD family nutrient uptake outer membrane protein n=1 Tax=Flavobacterium franklandianum TaxID=2594430 RepID=A0A553CU32_9FLAO|nr:RagB/SusD family nutrient uptake outer membrane protein [Flavobacterium franklandianum]TRX24032.1 RagB/SusD family nutrient uptake outer membrane protein [Flavobacterium franklandianum]TRX25367.1 RagB/SusD family nutrient uptake outer membrane protein [Flavobacterium franklandianum]